jgi:hypothetical protein
MVAMSIQPFFRIVPIKAILLQLVENQIFKHKKCSFRKSSRKGRKLGDKKVTIFQSRFGATV